ncbi:YdeI/OmpD-associated family protein [Paenibacillus alkaliterrae]|uniref:YdeI/OmpD-associated family protein n=1 Tax=Paenibacillus alkaliterrae TaxID=320909 RepID=UPI001F19B688|nr:YdeI/OmpD-associated family protein [Paenibacillus alkaliterrae]MCF2937259.1 YdeI/OmpD-associated family protein [Paenibacillus alkaliterrae]
MNEALVKKLRLSPEMKALVLKAPSDDYLEELGLTAETTVLDKGGQYDFVMLFVLSMAELEEHAPAAVNAVKNDGMLWITYPKGSSKIKTDINRDTGWKQMLKLNMEGVAMISVDDTWSSMRYRPEGTAPKKRTASASIAALNSGRASNSPADELPLPDDLAIALKTSSVADDFFRGSLTAAKRRDFIKWIIEAKREETRTNRVTAAIDKLERGLKSPFEK